MTAAAQYRFDHWMVDDVTGKRIWFIWKTAKLPEATRSKTVCPKHRFV
jgi:hypothetical protein